MITDAIRDKLVVANIVARVDENTFVAWFKDGFGTWTFGKGRKQYIYGLSENEVNELRYPKE